MTRAEQAALYAYPKKSAVSGVSMLGNNNRDDFMFQRDIFRKGYEQAEKDLALTWEDMKLIVNIADDILKGKTVFKSLHRFPLETVYYEEVLRRFNEIKHQL